MHLLVKEAVEELENQFCDLAYSTSQFFDKNEIEVSKIKCQLATMPVKNKALHEEFLENLWSTIRERKKANLDDDIWVELGKYWNFLNYSLLEYLINKFGDKALAERMEEYKRKLQEFRRSTRLCDFAQHFKSVTKNNLIDKNVTNKLEVKFYKNWEVCTLEDLENWKECITQKLFLPSFVTILHDINPGCISIVWTIPALYASSLMEGIDVKGLCEEHKIMQMSIDGVECCSAGESYY